jgi:hypothetical protein
MRSTAVAASGPVGRSRTTFDAWHPERGWTSPNLALAFASEQEARAYLDQQREKIEAGITQDEGADEMVDEGDPNAD